MLIHYCDGCSSKIPEEQFQNGEAYKTAGGTYCGQCVAKGVVKRPAHAQRPSHAPRAPTRIIKAERPVTRSPVLGTGAILGAIGIVLALIVFIFATTNNKHESNPPIAVTRNDPISEPVPAPQTQSPATPPKPAEPASPDADWVLYAANMLEDARKKYKEHPDDLRGYLQKLRNINSGYKNTPAGREAAKLLTELKSVESVPGNQDIATSEGAGLKERREAIAAIAKAKGSNELDELLWAISNAKAAAIPDLAQILAQSDHAALEKSRDRVVDIAIKSTEAVLRRGGIAALLHADGSAEPAWSMAFKIPRSAIDLLNSLTLLSQAEDAKVLDEVKAKVEALLKERPDANQVKPVSARFVRIELSGQPRPLTLAEVQIFSGNKNVALSGHATQSSTITSGDAQHAIDGKTDGNFFALTSSHTTGNEAIAWWEVDLGTEQIIDKVVIWNRTDGGPELPKRLEDFTLIALDANRVQVFKKEHNPAPRVNGTIELISEQTAIRRAAEEALTRISKGSAR